MESQTKQFQLPELSKLVTGERRAMQFNGIDVWGPVNAREAELYSAIRERIVVAWNALTVEDISDFLAVNSHVFKLEVQKDSRILIRYLPYMARWERRAAYLQRQFEKERKAALMAEPFKMTKAVEAALKAYERRCQGKPARKRKVITPEQREKAKEYWKVRAVRAKTLELRQKYWGYYMKVDKGGFTSEQQAALNSLSARVGGFKKHLGEVSGSFRKLHFKANKSDEDKALYKRLKALRAEKRKLYEDAKRVYEETESTFRQQNAQGKVARDDTASAD